MRIVEEFILSKTGGIDDCEDGIFVSDNFAAVIDGATSKTDIKHNGMSSGKLAMETIKSALATLPKDVSAQQAMNILSSSLAEFPKTINPSASIIVYSKFYHEIWMVGDCQGIADGRVFSNEKNIDEVLANARAAFIASELKSGKTVEELLNHDTGRDFIMPMLKRQNVFQNDIDYIEYSYGVIDGSEVPMREIKIIPLEKGIKSIVLASDGYPKLFSKLSESESYLEFLLRADPLCYTIHKSTKGLKEGNISFDDRAFLKIEI